jgi:hypothetical protein
MKPHVFRFKWNDVQEEEIVSIFRVKELFCWTLRMEATCSNELQSVVSRKAELFMKTLVRITARDIPLA